MYKILKLILISILFLNSCIKAPIELTFVEKNLTNKNPKIKYKIKNNTNQKYVFYIPESYLIRIYIKDQNGIEAEPSNPIYISKVLTKEMMNPFIGQRKRDSILMNELNSKGLKVDLNNTIEYRNQRNNRIILNPNQSVEFEREFTFSENQMRESGTYILFNKTKKYTIQAKIKFDSLKIKELLTKPDLDSLRKNKIKIYDGSLFTVKQHLEI